MGVLTGIEWCHHTWSPWRGCAAISDGCLNCYAEAGSLRNPSLFGTWGADGIRSIAAPASWRRVQKWNEAARESRERRRIFFSLGDPEEWPRELRVHEYPLVVAKTQEPKP